MFRSLFGRSKKYNPLNRIDVGTGGGGHVPPKTLQSTKKYPFCSEKMPLFSKGKGVLKASCPQV